MAFSFAKAEVLGTVTADASVKRTKGNREYVYFSVVTSYTQASNEKITKSFFPVFVFDSRLVKPASSLKKGDIIFVEGDLTYKYWEKDPIEAKGVIIIAYKLRIQSKKETRIRKRKELEDEARGISPTDA